MSRLLTCCALGFAGAAALVASGDVVGADASSQATFSLARNGNLSQNVLPGDFNGDGITDLAATSASTGRVRVVLGNGSGGFGAPIDTSYAGHVVAVSDFNGDGRRDLVVVDANRKNAAILPGNGDGTFGTARPITATDNITFAVAADFDGDGKRDLVIGIEPQTARVYPGNGDFTFGNPVDLTTGSFPIDAVVADLNGDGKSDLVVANHYGYSISVFMNLGAFGFAPSDITMGGAANDVAAGDLNRDGKLDLVVVTSNGGDQDTYFEDGHAELLLGRGDGTFNPAVRYQLPRGAWQVVVGDFTRDGIVDIATANRSSIYRDDCTYAWKTWDSLSILAGSGDGTFGSAQSFSIGNQAASASDMTYRSTVSTLATSDLNRDGATDLIASWGAIFLNKPTDPNWAPTVNAGPDQTLQNTSDTILHATAADSDQDMLTWLWTDEGGNPIDVVPTICVATLAPGSHTFTVTVDDGHGHRASDSVTVTVTKTTAIPPTVTVNAPNAGDMLTAGQPYTIRFTATPGDTPISEISVDFQSTSANQSYSICPSLPGTATECVWNSPGPAVTDGHIFVYAVDQDGDIGTGDSGAFTIQTGGNVLPSGWRHADVGGVAAAGAATYDGYTTGGGYGFTISGSGADIWGTADEFQYVWTTFTGDFQINAYVTSLQAAAAWTKAGIMVRAAATDPSSPHASIFVSGSKGIAFQRRTIEGGTSVSTAGPLTGVPVWLRVVRMGSTVKAFYRKQTTDGWTLIGTQTFATLPSTVNVGLAVTSHNDGALATAKFASVRLGALPLLTGAAIGGATGTITTDGTTYTVKGSGSDIWGTSDSFFFASTPIGSNEQISLRVRSLVNTDQWAKAGVMIRESLAANSKHADTIVSPSKGIASQYRATTGGSSANAAVSSGAAPIWLRIRRFEPTSGNDLLGSWSTDGVVWQTFCCVAPVVLAHDSLIGIAVTGHHAGVETTAVIDEVWIEQ